MINLIFLFCNLAKLKPLTLQEICRYKIRQTIRQAIEKDQPDYLKVKREMSTYNKIRNVTTTKAIKERRGRTFYGVEEDESDNDDQDIYDSDNDDEFGDEESGSEQSRANPSQTALARFERILRPRIGLNISYARFDRFDNQLRLLIGYLRTKMDFFPSIFKLKS